MTLLLLEGPDGGGKTTLAKTVLKDYAYQHNGPPPWTGMAADKSVAKRNEVFWWQLGNLVPKDATGRTVVDRSWPSEQAYGRVLDRPLVFHALAQRMFERYMLSVGGIVVLCLPPFHVARAAWKDRVNEGRELLNEEWQFAEIYAMYERWRTCLPVVDYDYSRDDDELLLDGIDQETLVPNPHPGILFGNPQAKILVVGEQSNLKWNEAGLHFPFIGPSRNAVWLAAQFERMAIPESAIAWINALQPDNRPTPAAVVGATVEVIVALGHTATRWAIQNGEHCHQLISVPHPAYWTRFNANDDTWPLHEHVHLLHHFT